MPSTIPDAHAANRRIPSIANSAFKQPDPNRDHERDRLPLRCHFAPDSHLRRVIASNNNKVETMPIPTKPTL
jgi:hypothetical protein